MARRGADGFDRGVIRSKLSWFAKLEFDACEAYVKSVGTVGRDSKASADRAWGVYLRTMRRIAQVKRCYQEVIACGEMEEPALEGKEGKKRKGVPAEKAEVDDWDLFKPFTVEESLR